MSDARDETRRILALVEPGLDALGDAVGGRAGLALGWLARAAVLLREALDRRTPEEVLAYLEQLPDADRLDLDELADDILAGEDD